MSVRLKLALLLAAAMGFVSAGSSAVYGMLQRRALSEVSEDAVRIIAESARAAAAEAQLSRDPLLVHDALTRLRRRTPELLGARVRYDGAWSGVEEAAEPNARFEIVELEGGAGVPPITVELRLSREALGAREAAAAERLRRDQRYAIGAALLASLLLAWPLGWGISSRLLVIEKAVARLGEGHREGANLDESGGDEIARLARGVNLTAARLAELDEMKSRFVVSVTHELRSPLHAIESYVRILLKEAESLTPTHRGQLRRIEANASRLAHFVTTLLDAAAIERGKLDYRPRVGDLAAVVVDAARFYEAQGRELGVSILTKAAPELPHASFDADLITQVVSNLVSNALKFSPRGGQVRVSVGRHGDFLECAVEDEGPGVPPHERNRLFLPFERTSASAGKPGTGLGLSICRAILERHGGRVELDLSAARGSRFRFRIPLSRSITIR